MGPQPIERMCLFVSRKGRVQDLQLSGCFFKWTLCLRQRLPHVPSPSPGSDMTHMCLCGASNLVEHLHLFLLIASRPFATQLSEDDI